MSDKTQLYLVLALVGLVLILAVATAVLWVNGGDPVLSAGAGVAAAAAAAEAERRRRAAAEKVEQVKEDIKASSDVVREDKAQVERDLDAARQEAQGMTDEEKEAAGEDHFGRGGV